MESDGHSPLRIFPHARITSEVFKETASLFNCARVYGRAILSWIDSAEVSRLATNPNGTDDRPIAGHVIYSDLYDWKDPGGDESAACPLSTIGFLDRPWADVSTATKLTSGVSGTNGESQRCAAGGRK
jgi:hypothetical protein